MVPAEDRSRALALFLTATSLAYVVGGPISGGLLELDGVAGLDGWQWLFLVEGLPSVALGIVTLRYLDERPADAEWLEPEERTYLSERLARELRETATVSDDRAGAGLLNGQVWLLGFVNFILLGAGFGLIFFVPDLVQDRTGYSNFEVGLLAAVPFAIATVAMLWVARRADRAPRRRPYVAAMGAVGATGHCSPRTPAPPSFSRWGSPCPRRACSPPSPSSGPCPRASSPAPRPPPALPSSP